MNEKKSGMWAKDYRVNFSVGDELVFDDFFLITNKKLRVHKFTVGKRVENNYICGLQFFYQGIEDPDYFKAGYAIGPNDLFNNKRYVTKTFELLEDEFIVEICGRKGMIIDNFGVKTNKGNHYEFGG